MVALAEQYTTTGSNLAQYVAQTEAASVSQFGFAESQKVVIQGTTQFGAVLKVAGSALKSFIASAASMAIATAAIWAVGKAFEYVDENIIHRSETIIKAGEEAKEAIDTAYEGLEKHSQTTIDLASDFTDSTESIKSTGDAIDAVAEKYMQLQSGVDTSTGENISLSSEDYEDYVEMSNQLAEQSPSLVSGYDAQGNAILNLGSNAKDAAENLKTMYDAQVLSSHVEMDNNIEDYYAGAVESIKELKKEKDKYDSEAALNKSYEKSYSNLETDIFDREDNLISIPSEISTKVTKKLLEDDIFPEGMGMSQRDDGGYNEDYIIDMSSMSDDQIKEYNDYVSSLIDTGDNSLKESYANLENEATQKSNSIQMQIEDSWNNVASYLGEYVETSSAFQGLDTSLQNAFIANLKNVDIETLVDEYDGDVRDFLYGAFITPMSELDGESQESLAGLLTLDKSNLKLTDLKKNVNDVLEAIFPDDKESQDTWKKVFGIQSQEDAYNDVVNKLRNLNFTDVEGLDLPGLINGLTLEQLDAAKAVLSGGFSGGTWDSFLSKLQSTVESASTTLSDVLSNTDDDSVSSAIDTFQSNVSSITETLQSLKTGDFSDTDLVDLIQQFPQLAGETDNLAQSLANIELDSIKDIFDDMDTSMSNASEEELKNAQNFKEKLLSTLDLSELDSESFFKNLIGDEADLAIVKRAHEFSSTYAALMQTDLGKSSLYKATLVDPDLINKSKEEVLEAWQSMIPTADELIKDDSSFQTEISDYVEKYQTLLEAQKTLKTGLLDSSTKKSLFEEFPELANDSDNLADSIDDLMESMDNDALDSFNDKINTLKLAGLTDEANQLQTYVDSVMDSVHELENATQRIANLEIDTPQYAALKEALDTSDSGAMYSDLLSQYETAKEAWQNGEVGTDDFKTFAALISPTGSADAVNFGENVSTFERYFQDSSTGVENFLEDLEKLNLASNESGHWTSTLGNNLDEMRNAAQQMGIGFEAFMTLFGRAEDYGATTDFFTTEEEGQQHLSDLYEQIAQKKLQLAEIKADPDLAGNQSAIDGLNQDLEELYSRVENTNKGIEELPEKAEYYTNENLEQAKDVISQMQEDIAEAQKEGKTELANQLIAQRDQYLQDNGYVLESVETPTVGTISAPAERTFENEQDQTDYTSVVDKVQTGSEKIKSALIELKQYSSSDLGNIDLFNGAYETGYENAEMALDNIISTLGLTKEEASQLINVLSDMGLLQVSPEVNLSTVQDQVETTKESLADLQEKGVITVDLDFNVEEMTPEELSSKITELQGVSVTLGAQGYTDQQAQVDQLIASLQSRQVTLQIQTELNEGADVDALLNMSDEELAVHFGFEASNTDLLEQTKSTLQYLKENGNVDTSVTVRLADDQIAAITGENTSTLTIEGNNTEAKKSADEAKTYADGLTGNISVSASIGAAERKADSAVNYINGLTANLNIGATIDSMRATIQQELSKEHKINVTANVTTNVTNSGGGSSSSSSSSSSSGSSSKKGSTADGTFRIARSSGTAYNVLNYRNAYASGSVALGSNELALTNELGKESIVRNGKWMLLPGGAHFEHLKKGDIVFNAKQTSELLKSGRVTSGGGHARAYASGTTSTANLLNWNKTRTQSGKTGSSSISDNTAAEKANTNAKNENTDATEESTEAAKKSKTTFDWVAERIELWGDKVSAIADQINDYISKKLKQSLLSKQIKQMDYQIGSNVKGEKKYMEKANSVAKSYTYYDDDNNAHKITISKYYQKLVQSGSYKIEDMDTSTTAGAGLAEAIEEYQKWYDKAKDCKQAVVDLKNEQMELFEQWANMPIENAEKSLEALQNGFAGLEATENRLSAAQSGGSTQKAMIGYMTQSANTASAKVTSTKETLNSAKNKVSSTSSTLKSAKTALLNAKGLTSAQKKAIKNNEYVSPSKIKNKTTKALVKKYNSARVAYNNAKDAKSTAQANYTTAKNKSKALNTDLKEASAAYNSGNELSYMNNLVDQNVADKQQEAKIQTDAWNETISNKNKYTQERNDLQDNIDNYNEKISKKGSSIVSKYSKSLTAAQKKALNSGKTVSTKGVTNKKLLSQLNTYNNLISKLSIAKSNLSTAEQKLNIVTEKEAEQATTAANAQTEAAQAAVDAVSTKFSNIQNYYEGQLKYQEQLNEATEKGIELAEEHGEYEKSSDYDTKIANVEKNKSIIEKEITDLTNELNAGVANGTIVKGSQEWIDMQTQIVESQNDVADYNIEIEKLKQQQIGVYYEEQFTRAIEKIEQFKDRLDALKDIITDDMMIDQNTGLLTEMGALSLTLNRDEFNSNLEELQKYFKEQAQIESEKYGEETYDSKIKEVESSINSLISANSSLQQEALSLIKNQTQAELDVLDKVISKRKEALKAKKDYYDYDKTLKEETKDIQILERQIAALEGSTNAEDKARKASLQEQLYDAQETQSDTILDHLYDLQTDSLDQLSSDMSEDFEKWTNTISSNLSEMSKAISEAVTNAGQSTTQVLNNLSTLLKNVGLTDAQIASVTTGIPGLARGTDYVNKSGLYRINEQGQELVNSKRYGLLTYLNQGDSVIDANMSKRILANAAAATSTNFPDFQKAAQELMSAMTTYNQSSSPIMNVSINIDGATDPVAVGNEVQKQILSLEKKMKKDFLTLR